ncbi:MAG: hypothetical protein UR12_C0051G0001 [candidate division TM6 bacterium GW2011_GWF2_30_66]|jgi:hypothetical protein|nr:MAG: hypothetical protein UR12_C0051G0001 [candidate division TM6 bacterium GW2011_GWF2_30_66]
MTKEAYLKLFTYSLLASFFCITKLSFALDDENIKINKTTTTQESTSSETETKSSIKDKIQDLKNIDLKKTANKTFYYSLGGASATISAASLCGLIYLFIKMHEIKQSYIKNFIFDIATKITLYFENKTQYKQYMIPGAIIGLSANTILSAIMASWMFRAGYKA